MSNEKTKNTNSRNQKSKRINGNRPFEDKLGSLITDDIDKRINDLFSKSVRTLRKDISDFKKDIQTNVDIDKRINDLYSQVVRKIKNENSTLKKDIVEQLSQYESELVNKKISGLECAIKEINEDTGGDEIKKILVAQKKTISSLRSEIVALKKKCLPYLEVKINDNEPIEVGVVHNQFEQLFNIVQTGLNVYLTGPAGSGKTTAAKNCADALGVDFYFTGAIASEFKLTGFIDANGKIVSTEFRKAYENGGLFLFDEIDGSFPQAVLAFNAALANDYMDFPDKRIKRHKNFYCIAAANTYGQGADRQYVGRNQLDAASIDRFVFVDWKYDEGLERKLSNNDNWVDFVQSVRQVVENKEIRHIVSPRASFFGAELLRNGITQEIVEDSVLWKGLDNATIQLIKNNM
ncbi:MAG: AAA family ATPase [Marinifilaceae bacterium]|jgi:hypothetical protein|nr:AAA family ATPase [Marinifilaceae bacterium]